MKVTFIYPDIFSWTPSKRFTGGFSGWYNIGLGYLSTSLKRAGHEVSLVHLIRKPDRREYIRRLRKEAPDLVGFSLTTNMFYYLEEFLPWTREAVNVPVTCGGAHPTLNPDEVLGNASIDMVCIGEGEKALVELCERMSRGDDYFDIPNLWVKSARKIYRNQVGPLSTDLDSLGFPDRSIFDFPNLELSKQGIGIFMASRGCPYRCHYCCNYALSKIYGENNFVRYRTVDHLLDEIESVVAEYKLSSVLFEDNILPLRRKWFKEFCSEYKRRIGLPFDVNCTADCVDEELVMLLKTAGCVRVRMGVESGNDFIRNEVLGKKVTAQQIKTAFSLFNKMGIKTSAYNMIGLPFEDMNRILDTIKLNAQLKPGSVTVQIFYPYKQTKLYEICQKNELLTSRTLTDILEGSILVNPHVSQSQIAFIARYFKLFVVMYQGIPPLPVKLKAVANRLFSRCLKPPFIYPCLLYLFNKLYIIRKILKQILPVGHRSWRLK